MAQKKSLIPAERIAQHILRIRDQNVMLDSDLAELYDVETKQLVRQVKRNRDRFPEDFMFQLSNQEFTILRSQFGTSSWGGRRTPPHAFTEQGVAMLSSVLRSKRAAEVNVEIMRTFVRMRAALASNEALRRKLRQLEDKVTKHDHEIGDIFVAIRQLIERPPKKSPKIGFKGKG